MEINIIHCMEDLCVKVCLSTWVGSCGGLLIDLFSGPQKERPAK